jgi:hypothetical protein
MNPLPLEVQRNQPFSPSSSLPFLLDFLGFRPATQWAFIPWNALAPSGKLGSSKRIREEFDEQ